MKSINEIDKILDSVYPQQINLKSFEKKPVLNPRIWIHNNLKKAIRKHLEIIAVNFVKDFEMPDCKIQDIVMVGSMAGYNWSKYSDIDLHIIIDFDSLSKYGSHDLLKKYFDMMKNDWNSKHDILIYGYPVEIYVQDTKEKNESNGVYSIKYGRWIKIPSSKNVTIDRELIKKQASQYINIIDKIEELSKQNLTKRQCSILKREIKRIHDEIVNDRRSSLKKSGEFSAQNIIFKVLRRSGHLAKIRDIKNNLYNRINSL